MKKLRIAQVAPLYESVPPKAYGGTERIVSYLTEELVRRGHQVTLFASGDSQTAARLVAPCPRALRLSNCLDSLAYHVVLLEEVFRRACQFDVIHFHVDYLHYALSRRQRLPHVTTLHGRLDLPDLVPLYREFQEIPVVSISRAQREPLPWLNWQGTVHHGLPADLLAYRDEPDDYLAFLGRVSTEKRLDLAIEIARRAGMDLRIAAKVDRADQDYFEQVIRPLLRQPHVEFLGEIGEKAKRDLLGRARALLFPVDWPEPFGLVMIEAMACGTPVKGLTAQGWKDSSDAVFHRDGTLAEGPIALCEVQGYVYAARREAATLARALGIAERSARLETQAEELRQRFEQVFWCEQLSTYALALDGEKRPCQVWPHDNALIAQGMARYGRKDGAAKVLTGLFEASHYFDLQRMPELFCGFRQRPHEGPTLYPVACAPQSWSAAAVYLLLQSCLGLDVDAPNQRICLERPQMPALIDRLSLRNLAVG